MVMFTNIIYDILFTNFNTLWVRRGITDFMKFNTIFEEFIEKEALKLINTNLSLSNSNKQIFY
jgi:hypothetical protein